MKRCDLLILLFCICLQAGAQPSVLRRVILIGGVKGDEQLVNAVRQQAAPDSNTILVFLGNNLDAKHPERLAATLAEVANTGAKCIFLSGHEEWRNGPKGLQQLQDLVKEAHALLLPKDGCPGPKTIDIGEDAKLILMDTQWWLQEGEKPGMESDCDCKNEQQVLDKLEDIVTDNRDKLIIFAAHHPFHTTGIRSGYFGPRQHIFPLTDIRGLHNAWVPLPGVGSLYPITRGVAISRQDMAHSAYARMSASLDAILSEHPFVIRAAGHEKVLELYEDDGRYYITSGAANRAGRAVRTRHTPFVGRHEGFAVIEISVDKKATAVFYEMAGGKARESFRKQLLDFHQRPPIKAAETSTPVAHDGDSVTAPVYAKYGEASGMKRFFLGNNYRAEWAAPITVPQFHLAQDAREFKIDGQGGGKQTTTIRLKDKDGKVWSLRSIVKDPEKVLAPMLRETVAQDVMKELMSASHPFAPVVANGLSDAVGIVRPKVEYYYVPDDTALGYYRPAFANTVVALEERQPSRHGEDTKGSWHVVNGHLEKWKHRVDARSYLRARLMDILLADFDRHYEQWKWGEEPMGDDSIKTYYAIPKDRDQALFSSDGLLIKLGSNQGMSYLKGLQEDIANIKSLGFVSRDIDAFFLNELTAADWQRELNSLTATLTDSVIHAAVQALPPPAIAAHGARIEARLKSRRDKLPRRGMDFYRFLADQVNVVGSGKDEVFLVTSSDSGMLVRVLSKKGELKYSRPFRRSETDEVVLYGMGGDDSFHVAANVPRGIRIRAVGGSGRDAYNMDGAAKTFIYDNPGAGSYVYDSRHTTNMISHRRDVNNYTFRENHYSSKAYPTVTLGYNIDDGFMAGLGATFTKRGFRAAPFTTQHRFTTLAAFEYKAFQARYLGTFNDAWRHYDVLVDAGVKHPALQNFFGLGNETTRDTLLPLAYYRVRYSYVSADLMVRKRAVKNKLSIALGPSIFYYWNNNDRNTGRILDDTKDYGLDSARIFSPKFYGGGKLSLDFNSIDNILLPTRGIRFHADGLAQTGLNESTLPFFRAQSDLSVFSPLSDNKRFIITLRGGGGHIFSNGFEYWQALTLGANNFLRGYRKNRFSGTSMAYGSAELRWRVARFQMRLMRGEVGLIGFQDAGRVWLRGESSDKWHLAYGGGFYFTPFNAVLISVLGAVSEEERLLNVSIGTGLNIVF